MTKGQIITFIIIARYYYALYSAKVVKFALIGDKEFECHRKKLIIVNSLIKRLKCYDPDAETNCLTEEQVYSTIQLIMQILGIKGDPMSLEEADDTCCSPIAGLTILT